MPDVAQRVGIALLFHDCGTRRALAALYPRE